MKKILVVLLVLTVSLSCMFAGGGKETSAKKTVTAALITNPKGTSVFINEGIAGFESACAKWGIKGTVVECKDTSEYESNARAAANEGYDIILGASWEAGSIISELAEIMTTSPSGSSTHWSIRRRSSASTTMRRKVPTSSASSRPHRRWGKPQLRIDQRKSERLLLQVEIRFLTGCPLHRSESQSYSTT